jgi:hypothetical protein
VLSDFQKRYGVKVIDQTARLPSCFRCPDLIAWQVLWETEAMRPQVRCDLRRRLNAIGWQYSEFGAQDLERNEQWRHFVFAAPMRLVPVPEIAFHATRRASVQSIRELGLLPSKPDISATGRFDCHGNIYLCQELGELPESPESEPQKATAMWWRWHFSHNNRFNDRNWVILAVRLRGLAVRVYRDIWSTSGLIVDSIDHVPPERIELPKWNRRFQIG